MYRNCYPSVSHYFPVPDKPYGFCGRKAPRKKTLRSQSSGAVCTGNCSGSLSHSSPVPDKPYGFCGPKAPRGKKKLLSHEAQELLLCVYRNCCRSLSPPPPHTHTSNPHPPVPNKPYSVHERRSSGVGVQELCEHAGTLIACPILPPSIKPPYGS